MCFYKVFGSEGSSPNWSKTFLRLQKNLVALIFCFYALYFSSVSFYVRQIFLLFQQSLNCLFLIYFLYHRIFLSTVCFYVVYFYLVAQWVNLHRFYYIHDCRMQWKVIFVYKRAFVFNFIICEKQLKFYFFAYFLFYTEKKK